MVVLRPAKRGRLENEGRSRRSNVLLDPRSDRVRPLVLGLVASLLACGPSNGGAEDDALQEFGQEVWSACSFACGAQQECAEHPFDIGACFLGCTDEIEHRMPPRPPCDQARLELADCKGTLDCSELAQLEDGAANPCSPEQMEVQACE